MATDPTDSFARQDTANQPSDSADSLWAYLSGSEIHMSAERSTGAPELSYHVFDTADDTWSITDETIEDIKDNSAQIGCSIAVRSDGDVIVLYTGDQDSDMGNPFDRVDYARREGGTWTFGIDVGGTTPADEHRIAGVVVRGSGDNMHFQYVHLDAGNNKLLRARSLPPANTPLSTERTSTTGVQQHQVAGVSYDDAGTQRVNFLVRLAGANQDLIAWRFTESSGALSTPVAETQINAAGVGAALANLTAIACSALDGNNDMHVMWSHETDLDLYRDTGASPQSSWGSDDEVIDATTINRISCNVYPRDGAIKLAFVYDEAGAIKYNEVSITAPTAPAMAASRFPDQNYKIGPFSV